MTARAQICGVDVYYDPERDGWVTAEDGKAYSCPVCGEKPTEEGHDPCLGTIPGAISACCGHGIASPFVAFPDVPTLLKVCSDRQFPLAKRFIGATLGQQACAVRDEAVEMLLAYTGGESSDRVCEETWDVIHAAETMLHLLEERGVDVQRIRAQVERKNLERGYYDNP